MTAERQARIFNSLLADVEQSLKARAEIVRYLSRSERDMLERAGFTISSYNPRGNEFFSCRISKGTG